MQYPLPVTIEIASKEDIEWCVDSFGAVYADELNIHGEYNPDHLKLYLQEIPCTAFLAKYDDGYVGGALAVLHVQPLTGILEATIIFWYVLEEFRGSNVHRKLDAAVEQWASERGARFIINSLYVPDRVRVCNRIMKSMGYRPLQTQYVKEIRPCPSSQNPSSS